MQTSRISTPLGLELGQSLLVFLDLSEVVVAEAIVAGIVDGVPLDNVVGPQEQILAPPSIEGIENGPSKHQEERPGQQPAPSSLVLLSQHTLMVKAFADSERTLHPANYVIGRAMYYVLPNFEAFDHKNMLVYAGSLSWPSWAWGLLYGALMSAGLLAVATAAWEGRELP